MRQQQRRHDWDEPATEREVMDQETISRILKDGESTPQEIFMATLQLQLNRLENEHDPADPEEQ